MDAVAGGGTRFDRTKTMTTTNDGSNYCDILATDTSAVSFDMPTTKLLPSNSDSKSLHEIRLENNDLISTRLADESHRPLDKKKEVYKFETDWLISNVSWSNDGTNKLALTSYIEQYKNFVQIVSLNKDESDQEIESICTFEHPYPATKILWSPPGGNNSLQLLATTADYLRLWRVTEDEFTSSPFETKKTSKRVKLDCLLNGNQGPLTSFDWTDDASLIVTSSYDSACTVWDVNAGKVTSSLSSEMVNHRGTSKVSTRDHHVYDVAWSHRATGRDEIVLCRGDSIMLSDLRQPANSSVMYEVDKQIMNTDKATLVRVSCSRQDSNLVASFADNSGQLLVIDMRKPGRPLCVLEHSDSVNSMSWSPKSSNGICSGGDDNQAFIWQVSDMEDQLNEPLLAYRANGKINAVSWSPSNIFIAVGYRNVLELLRV